MGNKSTFFDFDMGRKEYLDKMEGYIRVEETAIKSDKISFKEYYGIKLNNYVIGRNFIIPYEMSDLFCLMIAVMKSSPTYDKRKKEVSLEDIVIHNRDIVTFVGNLPPELTDYIKQTFEYENANVLLNCLPIVAERIAALLHIALKRGVPDDVDKLINGLDEIYERHFWELHAEDISDEASVEPYRSEATIETSYSYHLFDDMLAGLFRAIDRDNWPDGTESTVAVLIEQWKEKYKDDKDRDSKIKSEYLRWLSGNEWHVLNDPWGGGSETEDSLEETIEEYKDKYNKKTLIHPRYLGDESGSSEQETEKAEYRMEYELSQIKLSLQNQIDSFILRLFLGNLSTDLKEFTEILYQPESKYLSRPIFLFIEELLNKKPAEISNTRNSLSSYICSTLELLETHGTMYDRFIPLEYIVSILKGEKDIDGLCDEIFESIFVKIHSQKCDHFSENTRNYRELRDSIMSSAGKMLTEIIGKGARSARKTIIITPKDQGDTELKNTTMGVSRTTAVITKGRRDDS